MSSLVDVQIEEEKVEPGAAVAVMKLAFALETVIAGDAVDGMTQ